MAKMDMCLCRKKTTLGSYTKQMRTKTKEWKKQKTKIVRKTSIAAAKSSKKRYSHNKNTILQECIFCECLHCFLFVVHRLIGCWLLVRIRLHAMDEMFLTAVDMYKASNAFFFNTQTSFVGCWARSAPIPILFTVNSIEHSQKYTIHEKGLSHQNSLRWWWRRSFLFSYSFVRIISI